MDVSSTQPQGGLELASDFTQNSSVYSSRKISVSSESVRRHKETGTHTQKKSYDYEFETPLSTLQSSELSLAAKNHIIYLKSNRHDIYFLGDAGPTSSEITL